jgi:segregation and condensation protein B
MTMNTAADNTELKSILEALLFVNEKPLLVDQAKHLLQGLDAVRVRDCLVQLKEEYEAAQRGVRIVEVAGGFQMVSAAPYSEILKKFYKKQRVEHLSKPSLETLAIVAYKQPITRMEICAIRQVNCEGVIDNLTERGLIRIAGRRKTPGRPFVFGTTRQFLEYFGLRSLQDLPNMQEFAQLHKDTLVAQGEVEEIPEGVAATETSTAEGKDADQKTAQ